MGSESKTPGGSEPSRIRLSSFGPSLFDLDELAQLGQVTQDFIGSMPLGVVRPLHPRPELRRPTPVMPQLEVDKIDRFIERELSQQSACSERGHPLVALAHPGIDGFGRLVGVGVEIIHEDSVMALGTHALHPHQAVLPTRPPFADRRKQEPAQTIADVMCGSGRSETAEVTGGASRGREVGYSQSPGIRLPIPTPPSGGVGDSVGRFLVDLPLWVVWADMAGVARLRFARLFPAERVPQVTLLTLAGASIRLRPADVVAGLTGETGGGLGLERRKRHP